MSYALVVDDTIQSVGDLPESARRLDTGDWVLGLPDADVALQEECGYLVVEGTPRPPDTETTTFDMTVELVDGIPTEVWTERPKTEDELLVETETENEAAIITNLNEDMAAMQLILDDTNSNINSNPAQRIKEICRMLRRLGRLALDDLSGTE